ncbi:hypothetical protein Ddye_009339 [Dipteronia dyeriana]|uniref:Protein CHROMATIN REMODELING 24 n=1 Tax=Dipteronia dyeriana TaxID=168575 RepID=A0AAD9XBK4_9ROSI|nr:hypothetical protein Ddye_009339 [Dipteronia dyeriana]
MAAKSNRKPLSLNDRHYRLLQDLASPSKPTTNSSFSEEEEKTSMVKEPEASTKLTDDGCDDDVPEFSGITHFDDSAIEQKKPSEVKIDDITDFFKVSPRDNDHVENKSVHVISEEEKPTRVKIQGRRRLCKIASRYSSNGDNGAFVEGETNFSDITDFDSPPKAANVSEIYNNNGGNEIRDILNDLSSRLEFLSIEKKRMPKTINPADDFSRLVKNGDVGQGRKCNLPASDLFDTTLGATKNNAVESMVDDFEDCRSDDFGDEVHETKKMSRVLNKTEPGEDENLVSARQSFDSNNDEEGDVSLRVKSEGDDRLSRLHESKKNSQRVEKNEPKLEHERLRTIDRSFVSNRREEEEEEEEDDDDCVVVSAKNVVKKAERCDSKFKESDHLSLNNVHDVYRDDSFPEDEGSITLKGPRSSYTLCGRIAKMLFPHQREGLRWLWSLHCQGKGGILGDDMGLGKTMQICGFLTGLFHSRLIKRVLIVAPKTLLPHWIKELSAVGLSRMTREYFGTCTKTRQYELQYVLQDKGVLLTTYDIVRNNSKSLKGDNYFDDDDITWDYMILDEGHLIKNPSTQRAKSLLEIPSSHRIIISGTPIQNNLKELWALFNFCCPELLGDNKWFKDKFENPILRGNDKHASDRDKRVGSTVAKDLRERIQPYFLRRLKSEVFREDNATTAVSLSKKNEIIVWLRLTTCQRQLYEAFLNSELVLSAFDGSPLAALTILKKICDHPLILTKRAAEDLLDGMDSMLNPEDAGLAEKLAMHIADVAEKDDFQEQHDNVSCKISFILSLLDNLIPEGHKVLIFSQTRKMLNLIQESIVSNGYKFLRIDGTSKASDRVKIVDDFQERDVAPIFLLTSQVGGLGLTLTKADRVIVVDPAWNPSTDSQSVDRAYRIGQKKDVVVYRLMTSGTIEEKIYRKQVFKGGLFKTATEHKEQIRYFSQQDLRELFSIPKQGFDISITQQQLHEEHGHQLNMDESLVSHIKFLETLGIAGVSHHSLLFSKTAPVQVVEDEEQEIRRSRTTFVGNSSSKHTTERNVDGSEYAFNPKDMNLRNKSFSPSSEAKLTESDIKERISRLSQLLTNKGTVERLPDKGAKLQKQIVNLNLELNMIRMEKQSKQQEVIDLDDMTEEFDRVMNV